MAREGGDKTRLVLMVAAVLWISAAALVFVGLRLRLKPVLLVGLLDGMLALFVTVLAVNAGRGRQSGKPPDWGRN